MNLASIVNILGHVNEIHKNMDKPFIGGLNKQSRFRLGETVEWTYIPLTGKPRIIQHKSKIKKITQAKYFGKPFLYLVEYNGKKYWISDKNIG